MHDIFLTFLFEIAFFLPALVLAGLLSRKVEVKYLYTAVFLIVIDYFLLALPRKVPAIESLHLHYNWIGKIASIALSLFILTVSSPIRLRSGLNWKIKPETLKLSVILLGILAVAGLVVGALNDKETFSLETFAFQLFMPSLDEEFFFRGILLYLFSQAFTPSSKVIGARFGPAIAVTAWFAIVHSVMWKGGALQFDPVIFLVVGAVGSVLVALRMLSDSLLFPIVGHSLFNVLIQAVAIFG